MENRNGYVEKRYALSMDFVNQIGYEGHNELIGE
tara:strand:+ start:852 stop:953 length:102 start_codon:yes stop_codon:yes gene_type:complete